MAVTDNKSFQTNFKIPQWGYNEFKNELVSFRKGLRTINGEPGWFYFKLFFHFDDTVGLLGDVLSNNNFAINSNTARRYLNNRIPNNGFRSCNLLSRKQILEKFVTKLAMISNETPWLFDKIVGLDKAGYTMNDFSQGKQLEISCLEDTVSMNLTTLFSMYQYVCFDEIMGKEIIPENLRKFNMSVVIYHVPIKFYNTAFKNTVTGEEFKSKSLTGASLDYETRMSYKIYTFRNCEFDLESTLGIIPGTLDNAQPNNLGKTQIVIKYDKCFTHLMNEWDQLMFGADGIYYDPSNKIGTGENQNKRLQSIAKALDAINGNTSNKMDPKLLDYIGDNINELYRVSTQIDKDKSLGNIYNEDIQKRREDNIYFASIDNGVYLANLFDFNPVYFRGLVIQKNVSRGKPVHLTQVTGRQIGGTGNSVTFAAQSNYIGEGEGISKLPNFHDLHKVLNYSSEYRKYHDIWYKTSTYPQTEDFVNIYQFIENGRRQKRNMFGTLYAAPDYHNSLRDIVDSYVTAWNNIKGMWTSFKDQVTQEWKNTVNLFKF